MFKICRQKLIVAFVVSSLKKKWPTSSTKEWPGGGFVEVATNNEVHCSAIIVVVAACRRIHSDPKLIAAFVDRETNHPGTQWSTRWRKQKRCSGSFIEAEVSNEVYCSVVLVAVAAGRRIHSDSKLIVTFVSKDQKWLRSWIVAAATGASCWE